MIMESGTQEYTCPVCGSCERVMNYVAEAEKRKGTIKLDMPAASRVMQYVIAQPDKQPISGQKTPVIIARYDYCAKCGQEYCHSISWEVLTFGYQSGLVTPKLPRSSN